MFARLQTAPQPSQPRLSLDILYDVAQYLDVPDLKRFSTVCKFLYTPALRGLLSSVKLKTQDQLVSFCACVLANIGQRAPWIRELEIHTFVFEWEAMAPDDDADVSQDMRIVDISNMSALATILEQCQCLNSLAIHSVEPMIVSYPRFGSSVTSLPRLEELELSIEFDGSVVFDLLDQMRSHLRRLRIVFQGVDIQDAQFSPDNPTVLRRNTAHIEELHLGSSFYSWDAMRYFQWQSVHTLSIDSTRIDLNVLVQTFPNLRNLYLHDCPVVSHSPAGSLWPALDTLVQGSHRRRCICSIPCPIRCIEYPGSGWQVSASQAATIRSLLDFWQEAQPLVLILGRLSSNLDTDFWRRFGSICSNLRCLEFLLDITQHEDCVELVVRICIHLNMT